MTRKMGIQLRQVQKQQTALQVKSIHHWDFDIKSYATTLTIPRASLERTVEYMVNRVTARSQPLRVLIVGPGAGRIEVPFLDELANRFPAGRIQATCVDCSEASLEELRNTLREAGFTRKNSNRLTKRGITCTLACADFEDWQTPTPGQWDIVVAFFVISFFAEWLYGLKKIVSCLAEGGCLFLSQDAGDIRFLDNTFTPIDGDLRTALRDGVSTDRAVYYHLWQRYYSARAERGYPWEPLLSPSDMGPAEALLGTLTDCGLGDPSEWFEEPWQSSELSWEAWIEHVHQSRVFNCLCTIPAKLREELARELTFWLKNDAGRDLASSPVLTFGHRIFSFTARGAVGARSDATRGISSGVYRSLILERLAERRAFRGGADADASMARHLARLVTVHTQLPIRGEATLGVVSWELRELADPRAGTWSRQVPVMLLGELSQSEDRRRYLTSYAAYMCLESYRRERGHDLRLLSDLLIHDIPVKLLVEYVVGLSGSDKAEIQWSRDGFVTGVRCQLDRTYVERIRKATNELVQAARVHWAEEVHENQSFDFPTLGVVPLTRIRTLGEKLWQNERQQLLGLFDQCDRLCDSLARTLEDALGEAKARDSRLGRMEDAIIARNLAFLGYANAIVSGGVNVRHQWNRFLFVPARAQLSTIDLIEDQKSTQPEEAWETGVLGFAFYTSSTDNRVAKDARLTLRLRADMLGLEDGILEYSRLVRREAVKSAAAAIMSRNMSHNLGSHVLSRHALRRPDAECAMGDFQELERFLQARMDFVAQVATDWPKWTEGTRLVGELLRTLLAQRIVLEEIAASERIGAVLFRNDNTSEPSLPDGRGSIRFKCRKVPRCRWRAIDDGPNEPISSLPVFEVNDELRATVDLVDDVSVAIPGGVAGWHAFFVIVENVIRNAAKHGGRAGVTPLEIIIETLEDPEASVRVTTTDSLGVERSRPAHLVRIYDNISRVCRDPSTEPGPLLWGLRDRKGINDMIGTGIVDRGGKLRREHWGLAEMKIAAAYLQCRETDVLGREGADVTGESTDQELGEDGNVVLRAVESPLGTLAYEFFLLRPQLVGIYYAGNLIVRGGKT